MKFDQDWDAVFAQFGGRLFTIGAVCAAFGVIALLVLLAPYWTDLSRDGDAINHKDLVAFMRAGEMALSGEAPDAYDPLRFQAGLPAGNAAHLWLYPPSAFFVVAPLAALPFGLVKAGWIAATFVAAIAVARLALERKPLAAFSIAFSPATFCTLFVFQVAWFVAAGLSFALAQAARRPVLAGVLLGLLTIKPQYGLMAPVFLLATRNYKAFFAAALAAIGLAALSVPVFGIEAWSSFLNSMNGSHVGLTLQAQPGGVSAAQLAVKLGGGGAAAAAMQIVAIGVGASCVLLAARTLDEKGLVAVTLFASLAAAPSAWIYDWPLAAAALAFWGASRASWRPWFQATALFVWLAVMPAVFGAGGERSIIAPLTLFAGQCALLIVLIRARRRRPIDAAA